MAQDDAVIEWCGKAVAKNPAVYAYEDLISAYGWKGLRDETQPLITELYKMMPIYTIKRRVEIQAPWVNPVVRAELTRITEGLRKAGVREE